MTLCIKCKEEVDTNTDDPICIKCRKKAKARETYNQRMKHIRDVLKEDRKCVDCGWPLSDGWEHVRCNVCYNYSKDAMERRKSRLIGGGLCVVCGKNKSERGTMCSSCYDHDKTKTKNRYNRRREEGKCVGCGKDLDDDHICCKQCRDKQAAYQKIFRSKRIQMGKCVRCGNDRDTEKLHCNNCLKLLSDQQKKRIRRS